MFAADAKADIVSLYNDKSLYMDAAEATDWIFEGFQQLGDNKSPRVWEFSMLLNDGNSSTGMLTMSDFNGAGGLMQAPQGGDGTMTFWHNSANMYNIFFGDADFVNSFYMDIAPHSSWSAAINFAVTADYWLDGVKYTTDAVTVDMYNAFFGITLDEGAYLEAINFGSTGTPNNGYKIEAGFGNGGTVIEFIPDPNAVPEPATIAVLGLGLAGLGWARARRKKCRISTRQKGAIMKTSTTLTLVAAFAVIFSSVVRADLLNMYNININDTNNFNDNINLYQLFNNYFADQLGAAEGFYSSSNDLYNARGVDPYTDWTTNGSQMVGAFKVADLGHTMSMIDSSGNIVASLMHVGGTENIGAGFNGGITDLGSQTITGIPDGLNVNFRLDADWYGDLVYSWSSNPEMNDGSLGTAGDNMVHMLAFDITDLYNAKYGASNTSVFMFAWEDLHQTAINGGLAADWDYQDFVAIVTNVLPNNENTAAVPEPATMLIMGFGLAGLGLARARRRK